MNPVLPVFQIVMDDVIPLLLDEDDELQLPVDPKLLRKARRLLARSTLQHPTPPGERRPAGSTPPQHRGREYLPAHSGALDYATFTGLHEDQFEWLYNVMEPRLLALRETVNGPKRRYITRSWSPRTRLLLVLHWLKAYPSYRQLANAFGGHASTVLREIWDLLPKLCEVLYDLIEWPPADGESDFGAIDCTAHYRNRVHPFSSEFYRGDHHRHFLTAQVVCSLHGKLWDVQIGLGEFTYKIST